MVSAPLDPQVQRERLSPAWISNHLARPVHPMTPRGVPGHVPSKHSYGLRTPTSRPKHVPHDASADRHICPHRMPELGEPDGLH